GPSEGVKFCVCMRKRAFNKQELHKKKYVVLTVPSKTILLVQEPKLKDDLTKNLDNQAFKFDCLFTTKPLVQTVFQGGKAPCLAYGKMCSSKTHTMGVDFLENLNLEVYITFFEIYHGKVFDLLNKKAKLQVLKDGKQQRARWSASRSTRSGPPPLQAQVLLPSLPGPPQGPPPLWDSRASASIPAPTPCSHYTHPEVKAGVWAPLHAFHWGCLRSQHLSDTALPQAVLPGLPTPAGCSFW
uniref:Kinesin motor domain-containing protein n=1 Tax=Crocodylus porosus TaxID=8502 RepID=A0A7M4F2E3_CROPO